MNVLIINGSPRKDGNTSIAINEMIKVFKENNVEVHLYEIGTKDIRGCVACGKCREIKHCIFEDDVDELNKIFKEANGLVIASPVYYAQANGSLISLLQRMFHSSFFDKRMKVGASIGAARRGGLTSTYDELNKFFGISGMPIASGQYWNGIHGAKIGEANEDHEGLQMMRTLATNMVYLMKSIENMRLIEELPEKEKSQVTNFIRSINIK